MTRKLFSVACVVIPALGLTFSGEEAQARHRCCRVQQCCFNGGYQVGWQQDGWQQASFQQQPIQQEPIAPQPMQGQAVNQAGYQQGTCCQPRATCCGFQAACAVQGQGQFQPQPGYEGQAPAPPQEGQTPPRESAAPAPPPGETPPPAPRSN